MLALKKNHATLYREVVHLFADGRQTAFADYAADTMETVDSGHGWGEFRRYWTIHDPETLAHVDLEGKWVGLRGIGMVEAERREAGKVSHERRYYLTSVRDATTFGKAGVRIGGLRMGCIGCWTLPFGRMRVGRGSE